MKISVIGAGNVGGLTAMRLGLEELGDITLVDKVSGLAKGKAFDLEDAEPILKYNYNIVGTESITDIEGSDIIVITAGLPRKPGMTREELCNRNGKIIREVSLEIKKLAPRSILIVVTNPLDLMTYLCLKTTNFKPKRVFGIGISLDTARFANLISKELNIPASDIEACVIGTHGKDMLALANFTTIKGVKLNKFLNDRKIEELVFKTVSRGAEIVSLLGSGSAYFAPSAAIVAIIKSIIKDEKRVHGVSVYLNGEYSIKDVCIGIPCKIGKSGIEEVIKLNLNSQEEEALRQSAHRLKEQFNHDL